MTCENSTFHEEGTCELIKLDTKICNERIMACKRNRILFYIFTLVTMNEVITVFEIPRLGSRKVNRPDRETRFEK